MSRTTRLMQCTPQDVFDVLEDGWSYATWVVGAARIRAVEKAWPTAGSQIHHSVGLWPLLLSDNTEVVRYDPPREMELRVRAWPTGEGSVVIRCEAEGNQTRVTMDERAVNGPATLLPKAVQDLLLRPRNVEALKRLGYLAEREDRR